MYHTVLIEIGNLWTTSVREERGREEGRERESMKNSSQSSRHDQPKLVDVMYNPSPMFRGNPFSKATLKGKLQHRVILEHGMMGIHEFEIVRTQCKFFVEITFLTFYTDALF